MKVVDNCVFNTNFAQKSATWENVTLSSVIAKLEKLITNLNHNNPTTLLTPHSTRPPLRNLTTKQGVTLLLLHFLSNISINIAVAKPSWKLLTLIYVALFWAKCLFLNCCEGCVRQLDHNCFPQTMGHTFHVALFWAKFLFLYIC